MPRPGRPRATRRSTALPGHAYVYLNYGIHCLVNVVTEVARLAGRRADPRARSARRHRGDAAPPRARDERADAADPAAAIASHDLCRGPGNLTMAMGITLAENRLDLLGDRLFIEDRGIAAGPIAWGPRIGIRVGIDTPWRAWIAAIRRSRATSAQRAAHGLNRLG